MPIADSQGLGTIVNDDVTPPADPDVTIDDVTVTEGDAGTTNCTFTVTLSTRRHRHGHGQLRDRRRHRHRRPPTTPPPAAR